MDDPLFQRVLEAVKHIGRAKTIAAMRGDNQKLWDYIWHGKKTGKDLWTSNKERKQMNLHNTIN